jgi:cytochrome c biogenesis protein ResB
MKQNLFKSIADLRFAIFILLIIAALSIIGTVIEQDQSIETYKLNYPLTNRVFGFLSWDIILRFGFDHIYKTWWFITLILLFGLSLLTCTLLQQFPSLKVARRCQFFRTTQQFCRLNISTNLQHLSLSQLLFKIKENNYSIFQQKNIIYCYKGLIGRIAPIIVHFSMIIILIGAIIGSVGGFKAQEIIPKTETFHIQEFRPNRWELFDYSKLAQLSEAFSGAEIRQSIIEAMYHAFYEKREFTTEDICLSLTQLIPLSKLENNQTLKLKNWAVSGRIRLASSKSISLN